MNDEVATKKSLVPHITLIALVVVVVIGVYFWLGTDASNEPEPVQLPPPVVEAPPVQQPEPAEPEFEPEPEPEVEALPEIEEPLPEPEPLDISDAAVKTEVLEYTNYEAAASLLVNEGLLQRFVVSVTNAAKGDTAPNHQVLTPPTQTFRVYQQAGKEWIDSASYKRYTPYVEVLDAIDADILLQLFHKYQPAVEDIYAEIGDGSDDFEEVLADAINHLLDTPEVPVPVEVYTDSVMYKYADERLEALSTVQKQLLRTGPDNMRRIKAKLREIKDAL